MLTIDGSKGEGGGQMLRTSLSLSSVLQEPITIKNIRALRPKPGLAAQHLAGVKLVSQMSRAEVSGDRVGSKEVILKPTEKPSGVYEIDIGTAGSVSLLLQTGLYPGMFGHSEVKIKATGGTDVKWSPPMDYVDEVFLQASGLDELVGITARSRGFFPKGGGKVEMVIQPGKIDRVQPAFGDHWRVQSLAFSSNLPEDILDRMNASAEKVLDIDIKGKEVINGFSTGCGLTMWAANGSVIHGSSCIGEKGLPAEKVGRKAAEALKLEIQGGATADEHLADQLLIPIALFGGEFTCRYMTKHTQTNIDVIHQFLGNIIKTEKVGKLTNISCEGISV